MISKAPCRISFCGGGTDLFAYADRFGGCCLAVAIKKYVSVNGQQSMLSTVPVGSGLGSSGALAVARIHWALPELDRNKLIKAACQVEYMGQQDQAMAALGGFRWLMFKRNSVKSILLDVPAGLEESLSLVYLGKRVFSAKDILQSQTKSITENTNLYILHETLDIACEAKEAIVKEDMKEFCYLVNKSWELKRIHTPYTTTPEIDSYRDRVMKKGVLAFKVCGAGSGGFALLIKEPDLDIGEPVKFDTEGVKCIGE